MKKMLIAALCLLTLSGSAMAAQNVPKELQMSGTVTENTGSMITVKTTINRSTALLCILRTTPIYCKAAPAIILAPMM